MQPNPQQRRIIEFPSGQYYFDENKLGQGAEGQIYELISVKDNQKYALKIIHNDCEEEKKVLSLLKAKPHRNVVQIIDFSQQRNQLFIIMEHCEKKSLYDTIQNKLVDQKDLRYIMVSIADGLQHLHSLDIIHRDLKPENILVKVIKDHNGTNEQYIYKICDFGLSKIANITQTQQIGTCYYMAPELIQGKNYDNKVDIWSFGTIIYELITGHPFFDGQSKEKIYGDIIQYNNNQGFDNRLKLIQDEYRTLVSQMIITDPDKRIPLKEVIVQLRSKHRSVSVKKKQIQNQTNNPTLRFHQQQNQNFPRSISPSPKQFQNQNFNQQTKTNYFQCDQPKFNQNNCPQPISIQNNITQPQQNQNYFPKPQTNQNYIANGLKKIDI